MDAALGWLGDIIRSLLRFVPRFYVVRSTHEGVAWVRGKTVKRITPGFRMYWPFWTEVQLYPVVRQSINLPNQILTTKDDVSLVVSGIVIYEVSDIEAALTKQWSLGQTVADIAMAAIRGVIRGATYQEALAGEGDMTGAIQKKLRGWGVKVLRAELTDFARCKVVSLVSPDPAKHAYLDEEGDGE